MLSVDERSGYKKATQAAREKPANQKSLASSSTSAVMLWGLYHISQCAVLWSRLFDELKTQSRVTALGRYPVLGSWDCVTDLGLRIS